MLVARRARRSGRGDEVICPRSPSTRPPRRSRAAARRPSSPTSTRARSTSIPRTSRARITPRTRAIMPVHLFGRPAPLAELAALGAAADRGRGAGVRRAGHRRAPGIASTFSFYPTKNLFALGDGGLVAATRRRSSPSASACSASTARRRQEDFELVGYNSRLDEIHAAALRLFLPHLDGWTACAARLPRATRELGLGELVRAARGRAGPRLPHLRRAARPSATVSPRRCARRRSATRRTTCRRSTCSRRCATSATRRARCPRPSGRGARTSPCRCGPGSRAEQQERVVETVRAAVGVASRGMRTPDHPAPLCAARRRRASSPRRLVPHVPAPLRPGACRVFYEHLPRGTIFALVIAIKLAVFVALRLLQPLVALRVDARHVGRRARRHRRVARRRPRLYASRPYHGVAPAARRSRSSTCCCCSRSSPARGCSRAR